MEKKEVQFFQKISLQFPFKAGEDSEKVMAGENFPVKAGFSFQTHSGLKNWPRDTLPT